MPFISSDCKDAAGDSSRKKFEAVAIAAAAYGSFIVSSTGKAAAFGVNASGQLGLEVAVRPLLMLFKAAVCMICLKSMIPVHRCAVKHQVAFTRILYRLTGAL